MLGEHQIVAAARIRESLDQFGGAILADEPGLGKSFVAASVAANETAAGASVEVIVPASLVPQWRDTLRSFEVDARLLTHDGIVTDSFVPEPRRRLIVVDEAHAFRNPATQRYAALARRSVGARIVLVTATPVCNTIGDLRALVDLAVCDDALRSGGVPSIDVAFERRDRELIATIVSALVIRRGRDELPRWLQFGALHRRVVRHHVGSPGIEAALGSLRFPLTGGAAALIRQFLWRRLESSEAALLESLRRQRRFYERALESLANGRALPKREYRRVFAHEEDADAFQQVLFWEVFLSETTTADAAEVGEEIRRVDAFARCVGTSVKRETFVELCGEAREPVLVFTGFAATAADLHDAMRRRRPSALLTGRNRNEAAAAIEAFRRGAVDVLVSTDVGAEGLNLQRAGTVIHYDIPWNPVKLEQRDGRAHRIGQQREAVEAMYFIPEQRESRVMTIVAAKNRVRRRALGATEMALATFSPALRPRVAADAAVLRFSRALEAKGWSVPEPLVRRHRAGFERLLAEMSDEYIEEARLTALAELAAFEPWAASRPIRFAHL